MKLTADIARALGLRDVDDLVVGDRPGVPGRDRQAAYRRRQDLIFEKITERAAILTRAEETIRAWFGLELVDLVGAADRAAAIAQLRAAVPELAAPAPKAVPRAGSPAPVDQGDAEDPAVLMNKLADVLNAGAGAGDPRRPTAKRKPRPRR